MGRQDWFQVSLNKIYLEFRFKTNQNKMNKLLALSAVFAFAQLINASPMVESNKVSRAMDAAKLASLAVPPSQDRERRFASAFDTTPGLTCYNQEGNSATIQFECSMLGGAKYCASVSGPAGNARTCAIELLADMFAELGLTGPGCRTLQGTTFCLCSGSLCNRARFGIDEDDD